MQRTYDDQDEMLLKVNEKLADMIIQGKAALKSKVDVTEVDMILAEEREREKRIMKELGLQTPVGRRRRNTGSSSDYDYFGNLSDSGSYSAPESSFCDYGYGPTSGYATPNGYGYTSHNKYPSIHYNTPVQYGSPGMFDSSVESSPIGYTNDYSPSLPHSRYHHTVPPPSSNAYGGVYSGSIQNYGGPSSGRFGGIQPKGYEGYGGRISPNSSSNNFAGHINSSSNFGGYGGHMPPNNFGNPYGSNYGGYPGSNVNHYSGQNDYNYPY